MADITLRTGPLRAKSPQRGTSPCPRKDTLRTDVLRAKSLQRGTSQKHPVLALAHSLRSCRTLPFALACYGQSPCKGALRPVLLDTLRTGVLRAKSLQRGTSQKHPVLALAHSLRSCRTSLSSWIPSALACYGHFAETSCFWAMQDLNLRPPACKAGALNQLS